MRIVLAVWAATRLLILGAVLVTTPHDALAAFGNWDGTWYGSIVQHGYTFAMNGGPHNAAFFPLFPLLCEPLAWIGIRWPLSGLLVNGVAFLGAVLLIFAYARERFGETTARWTAILACVLPLSLFGSVAYAESCFMLFSAASLWFYHRERFVFAGLAGAAAALTRPLGIALAIAVLIAAIVERRSARAIAYCSLGILGTMAFPAFLYLRFHDALAFAHAQLAWRHPGFDGAGWFGIVRGAIGGRVHDWISLFFILVAIPCVVIYRKHFGKPDLIYVALFVLLIGASGTPFSVDRFCYSIVPILMAIGALCTRAPALGYVLVAVALVVLGADAIAFAQFKWVA